jgi:D-sedoheptulose 7-phosphate isomerase
METGNNVYLTVTDYFNTLSGLMKAMQATSRQGAPMPLDQATENAIQIILEVGVAAGKVMLVGNGGSAAVVSHVQNDLCKRVGVKSLVFTEQPLLTALANDHGYETAYQRNVELWAQPHDLLIAVSSSGRSENILRAAQAALERGCRVVTLSGFRPDNPLRQMGELNFYVGSDAYGYVETAHAALTHFMTDRAMMLRHVGSGQSGGRR